MSIISKNVLKGNMIQPRGPQGIPGEAATIEVGTVIKGTETKVINRGTSKNAIFDFIFDDTEVQALKAENKLLKSQIPTKTVTDNPINLTDSSNLPCEIAVLGANKQETSIVIESEMVDALIVGNSTISSSNLGKVAIIPCKPNTKYTIKKSATSKRFVLVDYATLWSPSDGSVLLNHANRLEPGNSLLETEYTTSSDANYIYVLFWYSSAGDTEDNVPTITATVDSPSIDYPSKIKTVEESIAITIGNGETSKTEILPIQNPMLEGDYFDLVNKKEVHNWLKVVEDGTGDWGVTKDEKNKTFQFDISVTNGGLYSKLLCNMSKRLSSVDWSKTSSFISYNSRFILLVAFNEMGFYEKLTADEALTLFKENLEKTNLIFYYTLIEPKKIPLTTEQVKILKSFNTYKNITNISTDSIGELEVTYYKDLETLNKKNEERILALENAILGGS